jgi:hypothetical protein
MLNQFFRNGRDGVGQDAFLIGNERKSPVANAEMGGCRSFPGLSLGPNGILKRCGDFSLLARGDAIEKRDRQRAASDGFGER